MKQNFFAVVVLYNCTVTDSQTIKNLANVVEHEIEIIVVDNSTLDNNNSDLCKKEGWYYISMGGNVGLPKAYNTVLDYLIPSFDGIVIWFDDDSNITQEYFDTLEFEISDNPETDVFVPVIQGQDGKLWSPNRYRFFRNKQLSDMSDTINNDEFNAINSCTAVRLKVYSNYRYDERLFLDQVDHSFFKEMRSRNTIFKKMNCKISHNFSLKSTMDSLDHVKKRYEIMIPDFIVFSSESKKTLYLAYIKVFGWGVREARRYNNIGFIFWCLKQAARVQK
ncbi:glycosyltransferase [Enterococcus hulanensis]|uniref:Glycosyltransferase n=1 Tax=Enterococcus hulanensis TaxID=2559929 RepID=A0ABU3F6X8_9ENTE|nr:glycosyltransferase [Enterococcus hulanensis]MDT2602298.1 glycosyltransferase [Enterococcus hulanensis]MDT2611693.1 glycosyltransferase [Enterococcus hulanensis]MDT2618909.1 glycosyltransferase [Enterococcus hulanensis]MDT2630370.1 glycosyltransferase [Enterococcus hulanensis]MDT2657856.1 glycosyltransferase [Enterococcus hulanensis]